MMEPLLIDEFVSKKSQNIPTPQHITKLGNTVIHLLALMKKGDFDSATVLDEKGDIQGIVTERTLLRALYLYEKKLRLCKEKQIKYLSEYDTLTGLPNQISVTRMLKDKIQSTTKATVLIIKITNFQKLNNMARQEISQMLLTLATQRIQENIEKDDILGRRNNDEFILYLANVQSRKQISKKAEQILLHLNTPCFIGSSYLYLDINIGICAITKSNTLNEIDLIQNASAALTHSKIKDKNNYQFFKKSLQGIELKNQQIEIQLHNAIQQNELIIHYQPQLNIKTNRIIGVEALLRWKNKELGIISPEQFIPLAENTGMILPISDWLLYEACHQMKQWGKQPTNFHLSINLPPCLFQTGSNKQKHPLLKKIKLILEETQLNPEQLELEITENTIMENYTEALMTINALKKIGVRIACDDFGTGYSSLNYLKKLPIDTLKIDKTFIDDIETNMQEKAIIKAITNLANSLQMQVIAEGVENLNQLNILEDLGCDIAQGYYISKPKPAKELNSLLMPKR